MPVAIIEKFMVAIPIFASAFDVLCYTLRGPTGDFFKALAGLAV